MHEVMTSTRDVPADDQDRRVLPGRLVHSGNLGVLTDDGYLPLVDPTKDMITTGGEHVASREVEEVIYELDAVAEVAVLFGVSHPRWLVTVNAVIVP